MYDVTVAPTASAISAAVASAPASGNAIIRVQPGMFELGKGSGSADQYWLDVGPASRSNKILIIPRDGWGTVTGNSGTTIASKDTNGYNIRLQNVAMLGFDFTTQGVNFRNAREAALGWSTFGWLQVVANSNNSTNLEMVECVLPDAQNQEEDRSAVRWANGYGITGLLFAGHYGAPAYKALGSSSHCDTLQFSSTEAGVTSSVIFKDSIFFQSSSQAIMYGGPQDIQLQHTAIIGGRRGTGRYPIGGDRFVITAENALWGGGAGVASDSLVMGSISSSFTWSSVTNSVNSPSSGTPASGWTFDPAYQSQSTPQNTWLDANAPYPTRSYLASAWAALG